MPKFNIAQNSFVAGELSPRVHARTDLAPYRAGAKEILNCFVQPQGAAAKRPGSQYIGSAIDSEDVRLIPFIFSDDEAYLIEVSTGTSNAIAWTNVDTLATGYISTTPSPATNSGLPVFGGYASGELHEIQYAQKGDLVYLAHPNHPPIIIARTAEDTFVLRMWYQGATGTGISDDDMHLAWPFLDANTDTSHTMVVDATGTGSKTLTSSESIFESTHVGAILTVRSASDYGWGVITAVTNGTTATINVYKEWSGPTSPRNQWRLSAWSDYEGWPRSLTFFESRLYWGGSLRQQDTVWASEAFAFRVLDKGSTFTVDLESDDPYNFTIASVESNQIQWLAPGKTLSIGTKGREYIARGSDSSESMNATNLIVSPETSHGSAYIQPVRISNSVVFIQKNSQTVREFNFNFEEDAFTGRDLSILADHMVRKSALEHVSFFAPKVLEQVYQEVDNGILWLVDNNGGLTGVTRDKIQQIVAFHTHRLGGDLSNEPPKIISATVLPSPDGTHDDLWVAVKRSIQSDSEGGTTDQIYIERIGKEFELGEIFNSSTDIQLKPVYSDSAKLSVQSTETKVFPGWDHLVGETVDLLANGIYQGQTIVPFGEETISNTDAETDVSGWSTFKDTLSSQAVLTVPGLVTESTDRINIIGHGYQNGYVVTYTTTGTAIGGLTDSTSYEVIDVETDSFRLKNLTTGVTISLTSDGVGTHTFTLVEPIDGTGGTPSVTLTRNTSSPLSGSGDFKFTAPASDVQGEGFSADITVSSEFQGKGYKISFDYDSSDANYAGDVKVYVINRDTGRRVDLYNDNAAIPAGASSGSYETHFTTQEGFANYRLIFVVTTDNASGYDLFLDNISVTNKGVITLEKNATELIAGLNYQSKIETLNLEAGSAIGSSQGTPKRFDRILLRFSRTIGGKIGDTSSEADLQHIEFRPVTLAENLPIPLFTGDKIVKFDGDIDEEVFIVFIHDIPLPMNLLGLFIRGQTND